MGTRRNAPKRRSLEQTLFGEPTEICVFLEYFSRCLRRKPAHALTVSELLRPLKEMLKLKFILCRADNPLPLKGGQAVLFLVYWQIIRLGANPEYP